MTNKKKTNKTPKSNVKKQASSWIDVNDCRWQKSRRYFQEQCFLIDLWSRNASKFENYSTYVALPRKEDKKYVLRDRLDRIQPDGLLDPPFEEVTTQKTVIDMNSLHGYDNFIILQTPNHEKILDLIMEGKTKDIVAFQKFKPVHLSALIPKIRLYKVIYDNKKNPLVKIPIFFPTSLGRYDKENGLSLEETILAGESTGGVGLEGFNWELNGTDPVAADFAISANLSIAMQNIADLETPLPLDRKSITKINSIPELLNYTPRYKDLLLPTNLAKFKKGKKSTVTPGGNQEFIPDYFRIKAEVGWNLPSNPESFFSGMEKNEVEEFKTAVKNSSITLDLILIDHTITFDDFGQLRINIQYQAAFEANLSSPDSELLIDKETRKAVDAYNTAESNTIKKIQDIKKSGLSKQKKKAELDKISRDFKKIQNAFLELKKKRKTFIFKQLIQNIENEGRVFTSLYDTKAIAAVYQEELVVPGVTVKIGNVVSRGQGTTYNSQFKQNIYNKYSAKIRNQYIRTLTKPWPYSLISNFKDIGTDQDSLRRKKRVSRIENLLKKRNVSQSTKDKLRKELNKLKLDKNARVSGIRWINKKERTKTGKSKKVGRPMYEISFFFLGDLINSAIKIAKEHANESSKFFDNTTFLFSDVQYFDPKADGGRGRLVSKNLADIPISYSLFREWFNDSVVKKNLNRYKLYDFFKDIFSGLLKDALGGKCYDQTNFGSKPTSVGIHHFTTKVPNKNPSKDPLKELGLNPSFLSSRAKFNRLDLSSGLINEFHNNLDSGGASKTRNWILFYVSNNSVTQRTGKIKQDILSGIPHFYIGSDTGILKRMTFQKENWQYFKELRILQKSGFGTLGTPYQVNVTTYGQPNFRPGQYIYINPKRPGITGNIGKELQLEGYYLIITVNSRISAGVFETSFNAKFETTGRDIKAIVYNSKDVDVPEIKRQKKTASQVQRKRTTRVQKAKSKPVDTRPNRSGSDRSGSDNWRNDAPADTGKTNENL